MGIQVTGRGLLSLTLNKIRLHPDRMLVPTLIHCDRSSAVQCSYMYLVLDFWVADLFVLTYIFIHTNKRDTLIMCACLSSKQPMHRIEKRFEDVRINLSVERSHRFSRYVYESIMIS